MDDLELIGMLNNEYSGIKVTHEYGHDRLVSDILDALDKFVYEHHNAKEESVELKEINKEMYKHIEKLEKMLVNRKAKFKDWDEVAYDKNLWW